MFGNPVGTTMTFKPFASVFSTATNGKTSPDPGAAAFWPAGFFTGEAFVIMRASRIKPGARNRVIEAPLGRSARRFYRGPADHPKPPGPPRREGPERAVSGPLPTCGPIVQIQIAPASPEFRRKGVEHVLEPDSCPRARTSARIRPGLLP